MALIDGFERVPVYILAGGKSRRYGADKARVRWHGDALVVRVAQLCAPVATTTTVVGRYNGQYDDLGLATIGDAVADKGPLGGLLTAIENCGEAHWLFLIACDWVGARREWLRLLASRIEDSARAVVYRAEHIEPLFGFYHTSIHGIVRERVERGSLAMHELLDEISTIEVPAPADWSAAVNLNQPGLRTR